MNRIYFKYVKHSLIPRVKTICPYKQSIYGTDILVNSITCRGCNYYCGKLKDKNAILCNGDEEYSKNSTNRIVLVEIVELETTWKDTYVF